MKLDVDKVYSPKKYEKKVYDSWEKSGYFNPDNLNLEKDAPFYSIVMPPPNVTGTLHLGHASMLAYEDILTRFYRMRGFRTLWVPGTDHAAIATQAKVDKIINSEGKNRHDLGRKKFLKRVEEFASNSHDTIVNQVRKMGSSCDWSREAYTLDEVRTRVVRSVFKMMHEDDLIYRGERIVNWCPCCRSTLSDDEVEYKDQNTKLYTFKYSKDFPFSIATTRPETKLGDTAVAVNPKDNRYKKYIGKEYKVDFLGIKLNLKIIADRNVDMEFGTGALGVTPAHSAVDWDMATKNDLKIIKVIDEEGKIKKDFGDFSNLPVKEARDLIVNGLKEQELIEKEEDVGNNLSICYRCDTAIEPLPSLQWFLDVNKKIPKYGKSIKELSTEAVRNGVFGREKINIFPKRFEKNYFHWMDNLRDWCISRQIWFGHQVPVWYKGEEIYVGIEEPKEDGWIQDRDTLDTWFSSGLWTFSTLVNSADQISIKDGKLVIDSDDFKNFHPTAVLETGYDILFFWIARMIIMTTYALEDIPFQDVYLHGLVLDDKGKKMSKSKGNVIDPLDTIEKFGADATRLSLIIGASSGNDLKLNEEKVASFRNFINKLWNVSRYILLSVDEKYYQIDSDIVPELKNLSEEWIVMELAKTIITVNNSIIYYNFSMAGEELRDFLWHKFADWYIEASKFNENDNKEEVLIFVLKNILKLLHPYIPFVTESIWSLLNEEKQLIIESWPNINCFIDFSAKNSNLGMGDDFKIIIDIIESIRNARSENNIEPAKKIEAIIHAGAKKDLIESQAHLIKKLKTGIDKIEIKEKREKIKDSIYLVIDDVEIYLIGAIDKDKERERINKEIDKLNNAINISEKKLENKDFTDKAPGEVVKKVEKILKTSRDEIKKLKNKISNL
ncbi:valine--tRNA ligase [bacterium]|nr:valine--tRNA ligase [bacterium]